MTPARVNSDAFERFVKSSSDQSQCLIEPHSKLNQELLLNLGLGYCIGFYRFLSSEVIAGAFSWRMQQRVKYLGSL